MKARLILLCLALSFGGIGLRAQQTQQKELPQVFSPNAAELGKYGKIPVSFFNGLPNISIPLTELHAKGFTLPVYLTYHASGNKPDQHPGWVGLGWTLHAGGCINRIVNGMKDEMTKSEYAFLYGGQGQPLPERNPGYYYISQSVQTTDWSDYPSVTDTIDYYIRDRDPDEFQICLDDIQASFFIYGPDEIRIVSKSDVDIKVELRLINNGLENPLTVYPSNTPGVDSLTASRYHYFDRIVVTSKDGTRYVFGGDDDAIEYSMRILPTFEYRGGTLPENVNVWKCSALANTWHLTKIERPDGEEIIFLYAKDGTPVVRQDAHRSEYYVIDMPNLPGYIYDTKQYASLKLNLSFTLLHPSYLEEITCKKSPDAVFFSRGQTTELKYPTTQEEFYVRAGRYDTSSQGRTLFTYEDIMSEDYYMQLSGITGVNRDIRFQYSSDPGRRLTLYQVSFRQGEDNDRRYVLEYNPTRLPNYQSRETDLWGFYNGIYYGGTRNQDQESLRRTTDTEKSQAEILTGIYYPTGGRTELFYEGHTYSSEMKQLPMSLVNRPSSRSAGGVRVKRIRDIASNGKAEERFLDYDSDGLSTGILAGMPRLYIDRGRHHVEFVVSGLPWNFPDHTVSYDALYYLYSENPIRPLSTTDGSHVTYSKVKETRADGSASIFEYSNHHLPPGRDTDPIRFTTCDSLFSVIPFNSHELFRGLLLKRTDLSVSGDPVRIEENSYHIDTTTFMKALSRDSACGERVRSYSYRKILTGHPYLEKKTIVLYDDDGNELKESTEFIYDSHRRLTEVRRNVAGTKERDTYTYTGNYSVIPYSDMISRNMIAYPVEHLRFRRDTLKSEVIVGAELSTWKLHGNHYVLSEQWKAALGPGVSPATFNAFSALSKDSRYGSAPELTYTQYDDNANPILSEDRSGLPITYVWTRDGCHPAAIFSGARNGFRTEVVQTETNGSVWEDLNLLSSGSSIDLEFTCNRSGLVEVFLDFVKAYGRTVWWRMDYGTEHQWAWPNLGPEEELEIQTLFSGNLSAGRHVFQVTAVQGNYTEVAEDEEEPEEDPDSGTGHGPWTSVTYGRFPKRALQNLVSWGSINVSFPSTEEQLEEARADDCLFEDFEDNALSTYEGFHGGKSYNGVMTLDFEPYPDKNYMIDWQERQSDGSWRYRSKTVDDQGPFTAGNSGKTIDHVRVFPVGTTVESYTWDPAGNLTSRTDSRGVTESYRYDGLGRLVGVYDNDGKKVEGYQYNYQNRGNE